MDLIDRYVIAVRRQLPRELADDIGAELADSLRSEVEEHERATGHPVTEAEQAALLKKRGHPWLMASRYQQQQYLIGPALFPYYRQALKVVVFWVVIPIALLSGIIHALYAGAADGLVPRVVSAAWNGAIYSVGIVTIVCAILDHEKLRITVLDSWKPEKLPEPSHGREIPRSETVMGLVFALAFLAWWLGLVHFPQSLFPDDLHFAPAPIFTTLSVPILIMAVAAAAIYLVDLVRPWRTMTVSLVDITVNAFSLVVLMMILSAGEYVIVSGPGVNEGNIDRAYWVNQIVQWNLLLVTVIASFDLVYELWQVLKWRRSALVLS